MVEETLFWNMLSHTIVALCYLVSAVAVAVFCMRQQRRVGFTLPQFYVCFGLVVHHIGASVMHAYRVLSSVLLSNDIFFLPPDASWIQNGMTLLPVVGLVLLTAPVAMGYARAWWLVSMSVIALIFLLSLITFDHDFSEPISAWGRAPMFRAAVFSFATTVYIIVAFLVAVYLTWRDTKLCLSSDQVSVLFGIFIGAIGQAYLHGYKAQFAYMKASGFVTSVQGFTEAHIYSMAIALFGQLFVLTPVVRYLIRLVREQRSKYC